jgi:hypothetical protein
LEEKLRKVIVETVEEEKPENLEQLVSHVRRKIPVSETVILKIVFALQNEGKIVLKSPPGQAPRTFVSYLKTRRAIWFWFTVLLSIATVISVISISENAPPLSYVRYVFGTLFVVLVIGYSLSMALFPSTLPVRTSSSSLDSVERLVLSIAISLAIVPAIAMILGYSFFGLSSDTILFGVLTATMMFASVGVVREYRAEMRRSS